jgi:hypothetical protein
MRSWLTSFLRDEAGYMAGPEWALVATILVLGAITGVIASRQDAAPDLDPPPAVQQR